MKAQKPKLAQIPILLFYLILFCGLFAGCSSSPSSGDGERAIQDRIKQESEGRIKLAKFEKTNGAQGESMGFKIYALEFNAEIEFTEDCKWVTGLFGKQLSFKTRKAVVKFDPWALEYNLEPGSIVKKGQRALMSGAVRFVKKEKGWTVDSLELSDAKLSDSTASSSSATHEAKADVENNEPSTAKRSELFREQAAKAQYELGKMHADGQGRETNAAVAVKLWREAAEQGNTPAQNALGTMYQLGKGVDRDRKEAVKWFQIAADSNSLSR